MPKRPPPARPEQIQLARTEKPWIQLSRIANLTENEGKHLTLTDAEAYQVMRSLDFIKTPQAPIKEQKTKSALSSEANILPQELEYAEPRNVALQDLAKRMKLQKALEVIAKHSDDRVKREALHKIINALKEKIEQDKELQRQTDYQNDALHDANEKKKKQILDLVATGFDKFFANKDLSGFEESLDIIDDLHRNIELEMKNLEEKRDLNEDNIQRAKEDLELLLAEGIVKDEALYKELKNLQAKFNVEETEEEPKPEGRALNLRQQIASDINIELTKLNQKKKTNLTEENKSIVNIENDTRMLIKQMSEELKLTFLSIPFDGEISYEGITEQYPKIVDKLDKMISIVSKNTQGIGRNVRLSVSILQQVLSVPEQVSPAKTRTGTQYSNRGKKRSKKQHRGRGGH